MKKILAVFLFMLITGICFGQTYPLTDFVETPLPVYPDEVWIKINHSMKGYAVKIVDGKLQVSLHQQSSARVDFKVPDGTLIAHDIGEWGGSLYFMPDDTTRKVFFVNGKQQTIVNQIATGRLLDIMPLDRLVRNLLRVAFGNTSSVFRYQNELYYLQGLDHGGGHEGSMWKITINNDTIKTQHLFNFDNSPLAVATQGELIYIATSKQLYVINKWTKQLIIDKGFGGLMGPGSIAVKNKNEVYIGTGGGYLKVNPITKQLEFYKYKDL